MLNNVFIFILYLSVTFSFFFFSCPKDRNGFDNSISGEMKRNMAGMMEEKWDLAPLLVLTAWTGTPKKTT